MPAVSSTPADALYRKLEADLHPYREAVVQHEVYKRVGDISALRVFMSNHVFAVWDFMSLLKTLQRRLTCIDVPWLPPADVVAARLVNEIVLGEETDEVEKGRFMSHFDLYLASMVEVGADSRAVRQFVREIREGKAPAASLAGLTIPPSTRAFVLSTLKTCEAPTLRVAASFLLGREDLVPDMFRGIIAGLEKLGNPCPSFHLYLDRHVHLDEEQHGPMAKRLLASLCGADPEKWAVATDAAREALTTRKALWDGVLAGLG